MKKIKFIFLNLFILTLLFSCSKDEVNPSTNLDSTIAYEKLDVSYGEDNDQKFDIYLPANRSLNTKYIVLVHGGGWTSGDKVDMSGFINIIQQNYPNLGIVNINYRLADDNNPAFPMQIDDITLIIDKLKEDRSFYTISDTFGFLGVSAGAHLSMLWSYTVDTEHKTKMVCSIVGPTNFTDPAYLDNTFNPVLQEFLTTFPNQTIAYLEQVSPFHQVTTSAPPTILFYGGMDPLIPTSQGVDMDEKLTSLGVTHQFTLYENEGHGWVGENGAEALDTWFKLKTFMDDHLVN